jgi:hypothetical protein
MTGEFEFAYPLFIIAESITPCEEPPEAVFQGLVTMEAKDGTQSLALFTNHLEAEGFRDEHMPESEIFEIRSKATLLSVLQVSKSQGVNAAAFDPFRAESPTWYLPIDDLLQQVHASPESPAQEPPEA